MEHRSHKDMQKLKRRLVLLAVLFVVITTVTLMSFLHSEPYQFATHFAESDSRVVQITGKPEKISLRFSQPFRYAFGDRSGSANMTLKSTSAQGQFDIEVHLSKRAGRWVINRAEVFSGAGLPLLQLGQTCPNAC